MTFSTPGGSSSPTSCAKYHDAQWRVRCGLDDDAVAGADCGSQFPCGHQQGKVPRNDLPNDTQRLLIVIGNGVIVDVRQAPFFGANTRGEVAEVVDDQGNVGVARLANGLAIVESFRKRQGLQILLQHVCDLQQEL